MDINFEQQLRKQLPVYVIDDEDTVRESLVFMLEGYGFHVIEYASGKAFLEETDLDRPGCMVLDSRMPDLRGQDVHNFVNFQGSPLSVIFLTGHGDVPMAVDALKKGAVDFFQKPVDGEALVSAIDKGLMVSQKRFQEAEVQRAYYALTVREQAVLKLIIKGLKNQEMADELYVSLRTIEVHRSNLMKKLSITRVTDLILRYGNIQ